MWALIKLIFDICCLAKTPQDIPYSKNLLTLLLLIYIAIAFLILSPSEGFFKGVLEVGVEVLLMIFFVWSTLFFYRKTPRFLQTLCAVTGTDSLISFFALPAMLALSVQGLSDLAGIIIMGLMIWHWVACGHIFRHALSQSLLFGLGLAFLYIVGTYQIMDLFFPSSELG
jgi:hypothetical protein